MDLETAKNHLRIDHNEDDDAIANILIPAAIDYIEQNDYLMVTQTWDMLLDRFPCRYNEPIVLWKSPVQSVASVEYVDANGSAQTWDVSKYQVALGYKPARIFPAYGEIWPITRCQPEAVTVRFTAGYDPNASPPAPIPPGLFAAMNLLIGHLYGNREAVIVLQGVVSLELPVGIKDMIDSVIGRARVY